MDATKKKGLHYGICLILSLFLLFLVAGAQPVKAYQTTIDTNGKTFYLFGDYLSSQDVNNCRLYMKTNYGSQLVASMNYDRNAGMTYSMSYGKKLYFCVEDSGFYDDYRFFEDYNLWVAMLMKGHKGYNVQENLLYMRAGQDMYKRRGGLGYIKCIFRFNNHLRKIGFISFGAFLKGIFVRIVVSIIPNGLRKTIYSKALRK